MTCFASETKKKAATTSKKIGMTQFVTPNPTNEINVLVEKRRQFTPSPGFYHHAIASHKDLSVRGFRIYLIQTLQKTSICAVSKNNESIEKIPLLSVNKKKRKQPAPKKKITRKRLKKLNRTTKKIKKLKKLPTDSNSEIFTVSVKENVTKVLSSEHFVFKPSTPINDINYPLFNIDKQVYTSQTPLVNNLSYCVTDPAIQNYSVYPSVSEILKETASEKTKFVLARWEQKMISDLGEEGFHNRSEAFKTRGTEFHKAVRNAVLGKTSKNCSQVIQKCLKSLTWMLQHITNPVAFESAVVHPELGYKGVADCIATFRNIPVVIDWKLSDKPKKYLKNTYDAPVQIAAYVGALNHDSNYKWGVNHGLVAVAYPNGDPCDVFLLMPKHCQIYWRHWLRRIDKFKSRSHLHLDHEIDEKSLELI